jgi:hypothetical protein
LSGLKFSSLIFGCFFFLLITIAKGGIVVNEVLANEPSSKTSLEWIEIYNNAPDSYSLQGYRLVTGSYEYVFPDTLTLASKEYLVICRKLFAFGSSPGFESWWGDSSGVWGDTREEAEIGCPVEAAFSLRNDSGRVQLYDNDDNLVSELEWITRGRDGVSWEKKWPDSGIVLQSVDLDGSTPGHVNSHTLLNNDLALEEVVVTSNNGITMITLIIISKGISPVVEASVFVCQDVEGDLQTITTLPVQNINSGDTVSFSTEFVFPGMYLPLVAILSDDDRMVNNRCDFMAVGTDYPPLVINEILVNPTGDMSTEWVELYNRSQEPQDLNGWQIGDANALHTITDSNIIIEAGEYLVLVDDSTAFAEFYIDMVRVVQPSSWSALNNDGDIIRLIDIYEIEADRFEYEQTYPDNYTWSRGEDIIHENQWGRSQFPGGTPGFENQVFFTQDANNNHIEITPTHFSPDNDGYEDSTVITFKAQSAVGYTLKIFDRQGRIVRTFFEDEPFIPDEVVWDGFTDNGNRLPVGIYIVYFEAIGVEAIKVPVVIAR